MIGQAGLPSVFSSRAAGGPWARDPGDSLPVPALSSLTVVFCRPRCFAFRACSFLDFRNRSRAELLLQQGGAHRKGRGERAPAPGAETPLFSCMCWNLFQQTFILLRRRGRPPPVSIICRISSVAGLPDRKGRMETSERNYKHE